MYLFNTNHIFITILGYPLSTPEFLATIFGLLNVYLATKEKISNYIFGILNIIFSFIIFFQIQIYSELFLQIYFLAVNIYGWWNWLHPNQDNLTDDNKLRISTNTTSTNIFSIFIIILGTILWGTFMKNIHLIIPTIFKLPAAFPYLDSFIAVSSLVAMYFMAKKKLDHWILWILIDTFSCVLYYMRNIKFISFEYLLFLFMAFFGYASWKKEYLNYINRKDNLANIT